MAKTIVQLGYGKMGRAVLSDLLRTSSFDQIVVADAAPTFLDDIRRISDPRLKAVPLNVDDAAGLRTLIKDAAVVVELLPIRFTMQVAQAAVDAGVHLVSSVFIIDWSVQDPVGAKRQQDQMAAIDAKARERGLTVLKEFGMDPGLDLIVAAETLRQLDRTDVLYTYGAGFPEARLAKANPLGYKFTWSIVDTIYSYAIPGSIQRDGKKIPIAADAMFDDNHWHILDLPEMGGPLECFVNGDGHSLAELFPAIAGTAHTMGRFICRRPGHAAFWQKMVKSGFNSGQPIRVGNVDVRPAEFVAALLGGQAQFHYGPGERDVALIRTDARGLKNGQPTRAIGQLVDFRDLDTGYTAMQRTVAFPMSIGAQMVASGEINKRGIITPTDVPYAPFLTQLRARGLDITMQTQPWTGGIDPGA